MYKLCNQHNGQIWLKNAKVQKIMADHIPL